MTTAERIYKARERWNCSFEQIAFLTDLTKKEVVRLYYQEKVKNLPKITIDGNIECLNLATRTQNCLKRAKIYTIRDLITYTGDFYALRGCGKQSLDEIADAIHCIQSVLKLNPASLIEIFVGKGTGGINVELNWMDNEPNYCKEITKWEVQSDRIEKVLSITGRQKGFMRTIRINIWLNQLLGKQLYTVLMLIADPRIANQKK